MRRDFDPTLIEADGRSAAKAQLFDPQTNGPWRGNVDGATFGAPLTILAYGNERPGEGPRLHVHSYDEVFIVVAGNARFFVGDKVIDATAGDIVLGPAGVPHRFENLGPGRFQTIDVHYSPKWLQVEQGCMKFDYTVTARWMRQRLIRHAWTTTQQKWTTSFVVGGLILATVVMPPLGIAVFGTAFAGWWFAVFLMTLVCGLVGNRFGIGRERAALKKMSQQPDTAKRA